MNFNKNKILAILAIVFAGSARCMDEISEKIAKAVFGSTPEYKKRKEIMEAVKDPLKYLEKEVEAATKSEKLKREALTGLSDKKIDQMFGRAKEGEQKSKAASDLIENMDWNQGPVFGSHCGRSASSR